MPEIGEVARIVHFLRQHIVGKTLASVTAQDDANVFGKVGCTSTEVEQALTGKKVLGAGQQGKYFWLEMASPPHPLMHFGMAGWMHIRGTRTAYFKNDKAKSKDLDEDWPPKYWKFQLKTDETPPTEAAFVDFRRFARVRLIDCVGDQIRKVSPLVENGPDPVIDKDIVTVEWLSTKCRSKRVPIKALLLDQANISGIGNWVGDELLYHARIHPEQFSNTLSDEQFQSLHKALHYVTGLAVDTLSDDSKFPQDWLFKHRWGKGKKDSTNRLPNGERIVFLTVGGRTSAVIPTLQKKTGPVAGDVKAEDLNGEEGKTKATATAKSKTKTSGTARAGVKRKRVKKEETEEEESDAEEEFNDDDDADDTEGADGADDSEAKEEEEEAVVTKKPAARQAKRAKPAAAPAPRKAKSKTMTASKSRPARKGTKAKVEAENGEDDSTSPRKANGKSATTNGRAKSTARKANGFAAAAAPAKASKQAAIEDESTGRRRSGRLLGKA